MAAISEYNFRMLRRSLRPVPARADRRFLRPAVLLLAALGGCSAAVAPERPRIVNPASPPASAPAPAFAPEVAPAPAPTVDEQGGTSEALLAYVDAMSKLSAADLGQEIRRLGDPGDSAPQTMRLAIALAQTRTPVNAIRAQSLLRRVLAQEGAQALYPLARLLLAHSTDTRRLEEQLERQGQQLRDAQRRIDQLSDRLEAVRAIERSVPSRPASAPAGNQR
jgi:hypothetical protein